MPLHAALKHFRQSDNETQPALTLGTATANLNSMNRPNKIEALPSFRIRVGYPDGTVGVIVLSADVGRGVFAPLADEAFFQTVHIGRFGQIAWSEDIEICPDAAYHEILGRHLSKRSGFSTLERTW